MTKASVQGPAKDFALHTIGWQAFQDIAASIAEIEYARPVTRLVKTSDEGRDGFFYGVPGEALAAGDARETTIQCKHVSDANEKLTPGSLTRELVSVRKLVESNRAHGYVLMTNAKVTEGDRKTIAAALSECGVAQPYIFGKEWVVAKILEHPRVRTLAPRVYGLGDLGWITDERALEQAKAIIDSMGDDLACYVPTRAHQKAAKALDKHRAVLLLGDPAVGKTSIAAALSVAATDEDGCDVVYVRNPAEFVATFNPDVEGRLFWIDDAFGSIQYAPDLADPWNKVFQTMKAAIKRRNRFILTSRSYIWRQAKADLKVAAFSPLVDGSIVVDVERLTEDEKERILYNHLKFGKQPPAFLRTLRPALDDVLALPTFRPEMARRLGDPAFTRSLHLTRDGVLDFFRNPERFLEETIGNLDRAFQAAIGLIFVNGGRLVSPLVASNASLLITEGFGVSLPDLKAALHAMNGSFVTHVSDDEESYWTYKHPTIGDAFANIVGKHEELITVYLSGAKMSQILREARCGVSDIKGASIAVGVSQYDLLLARFANAEDIPRPAIRRFLITRCGVRFFKAFLERFPEAFPWGIGLSRPVRDHDRTRLILKAHGFGLLPEEQREAFVDNLEDQIINAADIDFLIEDDAILELLTDEEREHLIGLARVDFVKELASAIDTEADAFEDGWDPDDWFNALEVNIEALERLFPQDEDILSAAQWARETISEKVTEIKQRIEEQEEEPMDDDYRRGGGRLVRSSPSAAFTGGRSIFNDLV